VQWKQAREGHGHQCKECAHQAVSRWQRRCWHSYEGPQVHI